MPKVNNLAVLGHPKRRGRPTKAEKLAIELARKVAGAVSAATAAARVSAARAREKGLRRGRGRPAKKKRSYSEIDQESEEEGEEVIRPRSRRKGEPTRAPGSFADWCVTPVVLPPVRRQSRDHKHLDLSATHIGKRETKRNKKFDEFVTFPTRKEESTAEERSRETRSSSGASDREADSHAGSQKRRPSPLRREAGSDSQIWDDIVRKIVEVQEAEYLSMEEAEKLKELARQRDVFLEAAYGAMSDSQTAFANVGKEILRRLLAVASV